MGNAAVAWGRSLYSSRHLQHPPPLGCHSGLSLHSCSRSYPTPYNWKQLFHCYMDCCLKQSSQIYWNQECPHHAPQPKEPEASVCRWKGADFHAGSSNIDTPFQDSRKKFHHMRSEQKEAFRWMKCCLFEVRFNSSNILWRNVWLEWTTLQACCSLPTGDWRYFFTQNFFYPMPLCHQESEFIQLAGWQV